MELGKHSQASEPLKSATVITEVGIEAFFTQCVDNGATILKPLAPTAWGTKDFYVEDPDGYIICFGGRPTGS